MNIREKLTLPESRKLEFKGTFPAKSDLLRTVIAFSNGAGGELIIGVDDQKREIVGVEDALSLEEKIANIIYDSIVPIVSPYISIYTIEGKEILIVNILPGNNPPYFKKSSGVERGTYVRIGSTNRLANAELIRELQRKAQGARKKPGNRVRFKIYY